MKKSIAIVTFIILIASILIPQTSYAGLIHEANHEASPRPTIGGGGSSNDSGGGG